METQERIIDNYNIGQQIEFTQSIERLITDNEVLRINKGDKGTVLGFADNNAVKSIGAAVQDQVKVLILTGPAKGQVITIEGVIVGVDYKGIAERLLRETNIKKTWLFKAGKRQLVADIETILKQYQ